MRQRRNAALATSLIAALIVVQQSLVFTGLGAIEAPRALVRTAEPAAAADGAAAPRAPREAGGAAEPPATGAGAGARARVASVAGDVFEPGVLLRAAAAVARPSASGRGGLEVVLLPVSLSYAHLGLNMLFNLQRLGYEHVLLLAPDERTCHNATALSPLPSRCVWDGRWARDAQLRERAHGWESLCQGGDCSSTAEPTASYRMWLSRWLANARLVSAGYDTLMLDVDVALLDDVLHFLTAPPLDRYTLLFHSESFGDPFGNVQCGLVYARASAPAGGATAAAVAGFALRALRFLDSAWEETALERARALKGTAAGAELLAQLERPLARGGPLFGQIGRPLPSAHDGGGSLRPPTAWANVRRRGYYFLFDQVHMVDAIQSQITGLATFRMARAYDADVNRHRGLDTAAFEMCDARADGTGSVAVIGEASARAYERACDDAPPPARARNVTTAPHSRAPAGGAPGAREPLTGHRVNDLYRRYLEARGFSPHWRRRSIRAELPDGWARRFALAPEHALIFESELKRGLPRDACDLPLEGGRPPLAAVREGSLAARLLAQLEEDAAAAPGRAAAPRTPTPAPTAGAPVERAAPASALPATSERASPAPVERVALIPTWLVSHWREGIKGGWGVDPPAAIAVHATNAVDKLLVLTAHGLFDRRAYAAAADSVHAAALVRAQRVPIVTYDPQLAAQAPLAAGGAHAGALARTRARAPLDFDSAHEWRAATLLGLAAAAVVSARVLAHAHVPCESAWLSHAQRAEGVAWTQSGCRTGLCADWKVVAVGYTSTDEAASRRAMRADPALATAAPRAQPLAAELPLTCDVHPNMAWPDGRVRWEYGSMCNGHAAFLDARQPFVGYALSAWDARAYAERVLGRDGRVEPGRNVAFASEAGERHAGRAPRGLLQVSERALRAELRRFRGQPIVYLGWPINVTDVAEGRGRLALRVRHFCARNFARERSAGVAELPWPRLDVPAEPPPDFGE